jgi:TrmH family RNA methyltransferase
MSGFHLKNGGGEKGGPRSVTSRDNSTFKELKKIAGSARERARRGMVLLEGRRLVEAYCSVVGEPEAIVLRDSAREDDSLAGLLDCRRARHDIIMKDALFREVSTVKSPPLVMAVVPKPVGEDSGEGDALLIEGVQDPGNLGAMLRSAAVAGVGTVFLSRECTDAWSPKCLRSGMGAQFLLTVVEGAVLEEVARSFGGTVIAMVPGARRAIYDIEMTGKMAFIIGNEGAGLSALLSEEADILAGIPMPGWKESLNAAAAASVVLFEMVRQRSRAGKGN